MAASAIQIVGGSILTTIPVTYYTGLANQSAQISQLMLYNADTVNAHLVNLWIGPSGSPEQKNQVGAIIVPAGATYSVYQVIKLIISTGQTLQAQADIDGVVTMIASAAILTS